jgi:hypothetical protein
MLQATHILNFLPTLYVPNTHISNFLPALHLLNTSSIGCSGFSGFALFTIAGAFSLQFLYKELSVRLIGRPIVKQGENPCKDKFWAFLHKPSLFFIHFW